MYLPPTSLWKQIPSFKSRPPFQRGYLEGVYTKRKKIAPFGNKVFPFRVFPFQKSTDEQEV